MCAIQNWESRNADFSFSVVVVAFFSIPHSGVNNNFYVVFLIIFGFAENEKIINNRMVLWNV
jgi:hypothetical protein